MGASSSSKKQQQQQRSGAAVVDPAFPTSAAAADASHRKPRAPPLPKDTVSRLLAQIQERGFAVNVVLSAPIGFGVEDFANAFCRLNGFLRITSSDAYRSQCVEHDRARQVALEQMMAPERDPLTRSAALYHQYELNQLSLVNTDQLAIAQQQQQQQQQQQDLLPVRVYVRGPLDCLKGSLEASKSLNLLTEQEFRQLEVAAHSSWNTAIVDCPPAVTLFVYLTCTESVYEQALTKYLEAVATERIPGPGFLTRKKGSVRHHRKPAAPPTSLSSSSSSSESEDTKKKRKKKKKDPLLPEEQRRKKYEENFRGYACESLRHLSRFYRENGVPQEKLMSIVIDCGGPFLAREDFAQMAFLSILEKINHLQQEEVWGAPDESRHAYLTSQLWRRDRLVVLPRTLVEAPVSEKSASHL
jgi:hypothetical protein